MFVAVNDKRRPSPFGGAEDELPLPFKYVSAPPNGEGDVCRLIL
jgi:hypothetical protein